MKERGFYILKDCFFEEFGDLNLKGNKKENRPHYYALCDNNTGLYWVVPMSSRIAKYRAIIEKREKEGKPCDTLHVCKLDNGGESVFLLQDMFPITEKYIRREYLVNGNPLRLTSDADARIVEKKARRVMNMIRRKIIFMPTQANVLYIEKQLQGE